MKRKRVVVLQQCPCCDYFTLASRGHYDICPLCFWEDDGVDVDEPDEYSGPNHMTLRDGRTNFLALGACDQHALQYVLPEAARANYALAKRSI